jgi:hypothetical protein
MSETWMKCAQTPGRIAEHIAKIVPVLDKIIVSKGGVVPGEFYRTRRRHRLTDGKGDCTRKPGARQRNATLVAKLLHPDLAVAYKALMDPAPAREGLTKRGGGDVAVVVYIFLHCIFILFIETKILGAESTGPHEAAWGVLPPLHLVSKLHERQKRQAIVCSMRN